MQLQLQVREPNVQRLATLAALSEEGFRELLEWFETRVSSLAGPSMMGSLHELRVCDQSDVSEISEAVVPLLLTFVADGATPAAVVAGVLDGIKEHTRRDVLVKPADLSRLKKRLLALLGSKEVGIKAKATALALDRGLLLADLKIVSDLRPVFSMTSPDKVEAFTILHTLVMECYDRDVPKKFHIALDMSDIDKLKKAVERAKAKEKALSKFVGASGVAKIEID